MQNLRLSLFLTSLLLLSSSSQAELKEMQISGVFEMEAVAIQSDSNGNSNDLLAPALEIEFYTRLTKQISIAFTLVAEDIGDSTSNTIADDAVINFRLGASTLTIGQSTLPFGRYETGAINDPLTLLLGETSETAFIYNRSTDVGLDYSVYLYNGKSSGSPVAKESLNDFGFAFNFNIDDWSIGAGYINNLANSDSLLDIGTTVNEKVAGMAMHLAFHFDDWHFFAEHVMALDDFVAGDLNGAISSKRKPTASHLEVLLDLEEDRYLSLNLSTSSQAVDLLDYESQFTLTYATMVMQQANLYFELLSAKEYNGNQDTILGVKLALDF
ncbi:MAG: LbtU family siderophore porin [Gammaproteobacteria bacterium]|nr:LbtU family siderophore porin [Gammaproteobacteria bacterium]